MARWPTSKEKADGSKAAILPTQTSTSADLAQHAQIYAITP
jgi:hypothetical protein